MFYILVGVGNRNDNSLKNKISDIRFSNNLGIGLSLAITKPTRLVKRDNERGFSDIRKYFMFKRTNVKL